MFRIDDALERPEQARADILDVALVALLDRPIRRPRRDAQDEWQLAVAVLDRRLEPLAAIDEPIAFSRS